MNDESERAGEAPGGITTRTAEIVVALVLFAIASLVIYDSARLGFRWGADGPGAGYFPFYIGLIIAVSSVVNLLQAAFGRARKRGQIFVEWQPLRQVLSVLLPAAVFVLGIQVIGIYVASAVYIAGFMLWLGGYGWIKSVLLGVAVAAVAFVTFEVWFQVPLYKGAFDPLAFLGY
jgi:hypothetical protein